MRIKDKAGIIWLRALIKHPMETGLRKDRKTGVQIPPHYINSVIVEANGEVVFSADLSASISENPFLLIQFDGGAGDEVRLTWADNLGNSDSVVQTVRQE
jgi:sulfur-oxidizing protein SoxZ